MSKKYLVLLSAVLAAALLLSVVGCAPAEDPTAEEGLTGEQTIVAILPLTGALGTFGENSKFAMELAAADVNAWLEENNKEWSLRLIVEDDATDGPTGLRKMTSWFGEGVKMFAGPMGSGVAREMLTFANANEILYISPSSTAPALAIEGDWLYRFCPADDIQGPAIAYAAQAAGVKHLIFTWRGDTWGDGLHAASKATAEELGIEIFQELRYDAALEDFTVQAATLDGWVTELVEAGVPLEEIGIVAISFEEIAPFMVATAEYPQLSQVLWFGSDGSAVSDALINSPVAAQFAVDTRFINSKARPEAEVEQSSKAKVRDHVMAELGREPDAYAYNSYDIIWALAMAIDEAGYDSVKVREILPRVADEWSAVYGAGGHLVLNEAGDRAFADYDYWLVNEDLEWEVVGYFDSRAKTINWAREIY